MAVAHKVIEQLPAQRAGDVRDAVNHAFLDGLQVSTLVCAGIALGAAIVVGWLLPAWEPAAIKLGKGNPMNNRVLVTGATGRIGGAVAAQLLEKGVTTRAMVHRDDARSARLRDLGAEVVVADMFDIQQVSAAMDGVDRLYFNPPYHPHALDSAVAFAVAARRSGVEAVVALGQWLASPEHPSLMTRHAWLTDKLFELLPDTAHVAVDPGYFADNYLQLVRWPPSWECCRRRPERAEMRLPPTKTSPGLRWVRCLTRTVMTVAPTARPDRDVVRSGDRRRGR